MLDAISSKNLLALYNHELMLVMQLLVRPRDTVGFITAVEDSLPSPPAKTSVQLADITTTVNHAQITLPQMPPPGPLAPQSLLPVIPRPAKVAKAPKSTMLPVSSVAVQTQLSSTLPALLLYTRRGWTQLQPMVVDSQVREQLYDHPAVCSLPPW